MKSTARRVRWKYLIGMASYVAIVYAAWCAYSAGRHAIIVQLLRQEKLAEARKELNGYHNWNALLHVIEHSKDLVLVQAAFDVQFQSWYSEDTNYSYPERADVTQRLLASGAIASYEHLVLATQQNKMQTARGFTKRRPKILPYAMLRIGEIWNW